MKITLLFFMVLTASSYHSQLLDINDVSAYIGNVPGRLFQNPAGGGVAGYEVPKGSGRRAIFATSLWCAAIDDTGGLHTAAMRFGSGNDFFAGPHSSSFDYSDSNYIATYANGAWFVSNGEVQNHLANYWQAGYTIPPNIANWPGNGINGVGVATNLAPFVDNNNNGIYEPALGEYPDIRGDQAYYLIMNDAAGVHTETGGLPLGIEVHTMIYQYVTADYRDRTTFLNYRIFNRGNNNYDEFKVSIWSDFDLGNPTDDYVGCDVTNNMMYVYNGLNDDAGANGYGLNPPAVGITSLNKTMDYFTYFTNGAVFPFSDPSSAVQYYNFMQGKWANGSDMFYGGTGATGSIPAKFMFPGNSDPTHLGTGGVNPGFTWDEVSAGNPQGDRRGVMTVEDVVLNVGDNECYDFAVLYARELGNDNIQNITSLQSVAVQAKIDYDLMSTFNCDQITLGLEQMSESQIGLFPNPTNGSFTISFGEQSISGDVTITDINGRVVLSEQISNVNVKSFDLNTKAGIYHVSISTEKGTIHKKLILTD